MKHRVGSNERPEIYSEPGWGRAMFKSLEVGYGREVVVCGCEVARDEIEDVPPRPILAR